MTEVEGKMTSKMPLKHPLRYSLMFPKESNKSENIIKGFLRCLAFLSKCWNNIGATLDESLEEDLKIEVRLYVVFPLIRVADDVVLLQKCSQSKGESRCIIIKLANIHVLAQHLYEGN